ncbi:hypothetical protein GQ44DRAFT_701744 [Phaeosphaeriaceae sp. PMI808]|nr:hypothetical protein GQ44DRAFT_701744 [Phaeosphaeriaceae sp. PMI808]
MWKMGGVVVDCLIITWHACLAPSYSGMLCAMKCCILPTVFLNVQVIPICWSATLLMLPQFTLKPGIWDASLPDAAKEKRKTSTFACLHPAFPTSHMTDALLPVWYQPRKGQENRTIRHLNHPSNWWINLASTTRQLECHAAI